MQEAAGSGHLGLQDDAWKGNRQPAGGHLRHPTARHDSDGVWRHFTEL